MSRAAARTAGASRRRAFTVVELSVTVFVLMIAFGLAVNLGNRVRGDATDALARRRLRLLTALMDRYVAAHGGAVPAVPPLVADVGPAAAATEAAAQAAARRNNAAVLACVAAVADPAARSAVAELFDAPPGRFPTELDDPWGSPIVYLPRQNPLVGMARDDRPFFVSAGPDRRFLTRQDNLYSYEDAAE